MESLIQILTQWASLNQVVGGFFYLGNKGFRWSAERARNVETVRTFRILGWAALIAGLPFIVAALAAKRDWIFAGLEIGGLPLLICGLFNEIHRKDLMPAWTGHIVRNGIMVGFGASLIDNSGITSVSQVCEMGAAAGFLFGSYGQARLDQKGQGKGYAWFMLMHASAITLFWFQDYPILLIQQVVSILIVADSYRLWSKKQKR